MGQLNASASANTEKGTPMISSTDSDMSDTTKSMQKRLDRLESLVQGLLPEDPRIKATHSRCVWCGVISPTVLSEHNWDWHDPECDWIGLMG